MTANYCFNPMRVLAGLMFFVLLSVTSLNAQNIVTNGNFTNNTAVSTNGRDDAAFERNRVNNWACSHGTPSLIVNTTPPIAWMWCMPDRTGEGIVANANFVAGQQYTVSFRYRTKHEIRQTGSVLNHQLRLNMLATSNLATGNINTGIPATPANSEVILTNSLVNTNTQWANMTFTFNCTRNNTQLWIYPTTVTGIPNGTQSELSIDNIAIVPVSCCPLTIQGNSTICRPSGNITYTATGATGSCSAYTWTISPAIPYTVSGNTISINPASIPTGVTQISLKAKVLCGGTSRCACYEGTFVAKVNPVLNASFNMSITTVNNTMSVSGAAAQNLAGSAHYWYLFEAKCPCPSATSISMVKSGSGVNFAHSPLTLGKCYRLYHIVFYNGCSTMTSKCFTVTNSKTALLRQAGQDEDNVPLPKEKQAELDKLINNQ